MNRSFPVVALGIVLCSCVAAWGQEPTARERQLEELVRKLTERVEQLESRLDQIAPQQQQRTQERVDQLEQTVQKIQQEDRPADVDSVNSKEFEKWISDSTTLRPYWKEGLRLDSNDGSVKLKIGGRIHADFRYFDENGIDEQFDEDLDQQSTDLRRARLFFMGTIYNYINFKVQYDFAGGDTDFKDVYVGLERVPFVGNFRVGQFKEPFSLQQLTSTNYVPFLERSFVDSFAPDRNTGFMVFDSMLDKRMTWAAGVFRQTNDFGNGTGGHGYDATARLTALPIYEDEGKKFFHLGLAYSWQNYKDDEVRIRARPEFGDGPRLLDTGTFFADHGNLIGTEAAFVIGPFSIQSEYVYAVYDGDSRLSGDPDFYAAYIQSSYFLTGEHRPYNQSAGAFGRVRPLRNFREDGGSGAWEVASRISYANFNSGRIKGGRQINYSLGLNWYLNANVRTMWNIIYGEPSSGGDITAYLWRVQLTF